MGRQLEDHDDWDEGCDHGESDDWNDDGDEERFDDSCPYCGQEIYEDSPRCPHCGQYISEEDAAPAACRGGSSSASCFACAWSRFGSSPSDC